MRNKWMIIDMEYNSMCNKMEKHFCVKVLVHAEMLRREIIETTEIFELEGCFTTQMEFAKKLLKQFTKIVKLSMPTSFANKLETMLQNVYECTYNSLRDGKDDDTNSMFNELISIVAYCTHMHLCHSIPTKTSELFVNDHEFKVRFMNYMINTMKANILRMFEIIIGEKHFGGGFIANKTFDGETTNALLRKWLSFVMENDDFERDRWFNEIHINFMCEIMDEICNVIITRTS